MTSKNIVIIGYGEIGKSIHGLYKEADPQEQQFKVFVVDTKTSEEEKKLIKDAGIAFCHVALPFSIIKIFGDIVVSYIQEFDPELTILHSTVGVGTTRMLADITRKKLVHSPVMGMHPDLTESIQAFRKMVGSTNKEWTDDCIEHFKQLGVIGEDYGAPENSELGKMISTTFYGWTIHFMKQVHNVTEKLNMDFSKVYEETMKIYNEGYQALDKGHFTRPILTPMGKGIGGHCVLENCITLNDQGLLSPIARTVLSEGKPEDYDKNTRIWIYSEFFGKQRSPDDIAIDLGITTKQLVDRMNELSIVNLSKWFSRREKKEIEDKE